MNKAEVINGLNMAIKGLETLRDAVQSDSGEAKTSAPASTKPAIFHKLCFVVQLRSLDINIS